MMRSWAILILFCFPLLGLGQDFHFSQYFLSPQSLDPALTGVFNGQLRVSSNYRNQWSNTFTPFLTYSAAADGSFLKEELNGDFFGAGAFVLKDVAGDNDMTTTQLQLGGSYSKQLAEDPHHYLCFGLQAGYVQRVLAVDGLEFGSIWEREVNLDPAVPLGKVTLSYLDLSTGLFWFGTLNNGMDVYAGFAIFHINSPQQNFAHRSNDRLSMKHAFHGGSEIWLSNELHLMPNLLVLVQGPSTEIDMGSYVKYIVDEHDNINLYGGSWLRMVGAYQSGVDADALVTGARLDYRNFTLGLSYDVNLSGLSMASRSNGGPELSLVFITPLHPHRGTAKHCPKF